MQPLHQIFPQVQDRTLPTASKKKQENQPKSKKQTYSPNREKGHMQLPNIQSLPQKSKIWLHLHHPGLDDRVFSELRDVPLGDAEIVWKLCFGTPSWSQMCANTNAGDVAQTQHLSTGSSREVVSLEAELTFELPVFGIFKAWETWEYMLMPHSILQKWSKNCHFWPFVWFFRICVSTTRGTFPLSATTWRFWKNPSGGHADAVQSTDPCTSSTWTLIGDILKWTKCHPRWQRWSKELGELIHLVTWDMGITTSTKPRTTGHEACIYSGWKNPNLWAGYVLPKERQWTKPPLAGYKLKGIVVQCHFQTNIDPHCIPQTGEGILPFPKFQ